MDWKKLIADLMGVMTQQEIAAHCGVAQSTVSDLHRGQTQAPSFDLGDALRTLHKQRVPADRSRKAAAV